MNIDISAALFTLSFSIFINNSQCEDGNSDVGFHSNTAIESY